MKINWNLIIHVFIKFELVCGLHLHRDERVHWSGFVALYTVFIHKHSGQRTNRKIYTAVHILFKMLVFFFCVCSVFE